MIIEIKITTPNIVKDFRNNVTNKRLSSTTNQIRIFTEFTYAQKNLLASYLFSRVYIQTNTYTPKNNQNKDIGKN